jgi:transcriptional regulator with PAS, ATPase and Fis domain
VLETGEFIRVGSSKVIKTNVRVIAATNMDVAKLIQETRFREDLFYRLNTVPIVIPPLRDRKDDILLLFRKFALDFAERYRMPAVNLTEDAKDLLVNYRWPGNIRQLKNLTEQLSVIEQNREITADVLRNYLPDYFDSKLPALVDSVDQKTFASEREILYKLLFDMKNDMNDLKKLVLDIMAKGSVTGEVKEDNEHLIKKLYQSVDSEEFEESLKPVKTIEYNRRDESNIQDTEEIIEESLSLEDKEIELIRKALEKHSGKRKYAAQELGISERTLYRKIKEYDIT